jgi:iron-sulfur cluster repair protein YtfE (RIC family)
MTHDTSAIASSIDARSTVNDIVARYPSTLAVFNAFGIDSCCGGALPMSEAASRHGIPLNVLRSALESAIGATAKSA